MENTNPNTAKVQHVTKASSDELLKKFAEVGSESNDKSLAKKELRLAKRVNRSQAANNGGGCSGQGERKSLLPPATSRRPVALIRRFGIGKAKTRTGEFKNRSILGTIEKTWRRTVEGASRVWMEKHYNQHKRLINDLY
ncbi:Hypothetical predicted protein [Olea europaea subsp. europaea]|uniref:Uncharacterized protein n=1 Tax=Olea europaea subsp. europaea TaxID=158383 RepID=A0A8S0VIA0_OLEEU|nr:Hypothetical predicted protein [Olea europaea subsp. europaea]